MKKLCVFALLFFTSCSLVTSGRHIGQVSVSTALSVLSTVQDTEMTLVCGRSTAPEPPLCVNMDTHHTISAKLEQGFKLEKDVAKLVRATPEGGLPPAQIMDLVASISQLVTDVIGLLPDSQNKQSLINNLKVK